MIPMATKIRYWVDETGQVLEEMEDGRISRLSLPDVVEKLEALEKRVAAFGGSIRVIVRLWNRTDLQSGQGLEAFCNAIGDAEWIVDGQGDPNG